MYIAPAAPSHLETFDYRPELARANGSPSGGRITKAAAIAPVAEPEAPTCLAPQHPFKRRQERLESRPYSETEQSSTDEMCIGPLDETEAIKPTTRPTPSDEQGTTITGRTAYGARGWGVTGWASGTQ